MNSLTRIAAFCIFTILSIQSTAQNAQALMDACYASIGVDVCNPIHDNIFKAIGKKPVSLIEGIKNDYISKTRSHEYTLYYDSPNIAIYAKDQNGIFYVSSIKIWLDDESVINKCNFQCNEISLLKTMTDYQKGEIEVKDGKMIFPDKGIYCRATYHNIWHKRESKSIKLRIKEELKACGIKISKSQMMVNEIVLELDHTFEPKGLPEKTCVPDYYLFKNHDQLEMAKAYLPEIDSVLKLSPKILKEKGLPYTESDQRDFNYALRKNLIFKDPDTVVGKDHFKNIINGLLTGTNVEGSNYRSIVDEDADEAGKYIGNFVYGVPHGHIVFIPSYFEKAHAHKIDLMFNYGIDVKYRDSVSKGDYKLVATIDENGNVVNGPAKHLYTNGLEVDFIYYNNLPQYQRTVLAEQMYYEGEVDENYLPHGNGKIKFHPLSQNYKFTYKSIRGEFNHGKPIKGNLYALDYKYHGDIEAPLDENFLPHSPEEYSVHAVKKHVNETYHIWTNYIHGKPQTLAIKVFKDGNFKREYFGKGLDNLNPSSSDYSYKYKWDHPNYKYEAAEQKQEQIATTDGKVDEIMRKQGYKRVYDINVFTQNGKTYVILDPHKVSRITVIDYYKSANAVTVYAYFQKGSKRSTAYPTTTLQMKTTGTGKERYTNIGVPRSPGVLEALRETGVSELVFELTPNTFATLNILAYSF